MRLGRLFELVIEFGREKDPRKNIKREKPPFPDTAILYGDKDKEVKKILIGIDIEVAEILLADRIREREGLDLVISHHPQGFAWAGFYEVMKMQIDILISLGINKKIASEVMDRRIKEVERKVSAVNYNRAVDCARLVDIPFMCIHTPSDNFVYSFMQKYMERKKPKTLSDVIEELKRIPEYKIAERNCAGPKIILGKPSDIAGRILVEMTGGTEGSKEVFGRLSQIGINTLLCMHLSEEHFKRVKDEYLNVIIAGHIASDTLGLNLLFDKLESEEKFEIVECSGFRRIKHGVYS
jgi:putative NIF3 family GTP cyclohydrolase 1 type 2